jgi:hypothetical protein
MLDSNFLVLSKLQENAGESTTGLILKALLSNRKVKRLNFLAEFCRFHYIDSIKSHHMDFSIMYGIDQFERLFISVKWPSYKEELNFPKTLH